MIRNDYMEKEKYFIKTSDKETAEYLRKAGFQELAMENSKWVFVNDPSKMQFAKDNKNVLYTDILTF